MRNAIACARLEIARTNAYGRALGLIGVPFIVLVAYALFYLMAKAPSSMTISPLVMGALFSGVIWGSLSLTATYMEEKGNHRAIAIVIPASRSTQVAGRYLYALMCLAGALADYAVMVVAQRLLEGTLAGTYPLAGLGVLFVAFVIMVAFMVPLMTWLGYRKGFFVWVGVWTVLGFIIGFFSGFYDEETADLPIYRWTFGAIDWFTAASWRPPVVGALVLVALTVASYLTTRAIWRRRQL